MLNGSAVVQPQLPEVAPQKEEGQAPGATANAPLRGTQDRKGVRAKPKDIPVMTLEQKAAPGRAATGLAREELRKAARADGEPGVDAGMEASASAALPQDAPP